MTGAAGRGIRHHGGICEMENDTILRPDFAVGVLEYAVHVSWEIIRQPSRRANGFLLAGVFHRRKFRFHNNSSGCVAAPHYEPAAADTFPSRRAAHGPCGICHDASAFNSNMRIAAA
jgi:hypothetical protein